MAVKARGRMEITDCALGCGYRGKTVDVRRHERDRCRRRMVVCPHEGCEVWIPFEEIPAHSMVCQAVVAKRERDMDKRSWTRNLQTHPDLVAYVSFSLTLSPPLSLSLYLPLSISVV